MFDHQLAAVRHDLQKEQQYPNDRRLIAEGLNSYCVVPLIIGGKSIGTLNLASKKTNQYCEADADLLCGLANQVALAVSNMTSYEEIAALNTEVEQYCRALSHAPGDQQRDHHPPDPRRAAPARYFRGILRRIIPFSGAALTLYNPQTETFRYLAMESTTFPRTTCEPGWSSTVTRPSRLGIRPSTRRQARRP